MGRKGWWNVKRLKIFFFLLTFLLNFLFIIPEIFAQGKGDGSIGQLMADVPVTVEINQPFDIDIWFEPSDPKRTEAVTVYMEQNRDIRYDPRVFRLDPRTRKTIHARLINSRSGLGVVKGKCTGCTNIEEAVNAGFPLKFSAPKLEKPIESDENRYFTIDFIDNAGRPVPLDATVNFYLRAYNASFRTKTENWSREVFFDSERGNSATVPLRLRPDSLRGAKGMIRVEAKINKNDPLRSENIEFSIVPSQTFLLLMAMLGGMLYSLYLISKDITTVPSPFRWLLTSGLLRVSGGAITGLLSYFFVDWDILGIKVDTTTVRGFVILGFLFSYVGIDTVLKKFAKGK
jgi:hypothetical protein